MSSHVATVPDVTSRIQEALADKEAPVSSTDLQTLLQTQGVPSAMVSAGIAYGVQQHRLKLDGQFNVLDIERARQE